MTLGILLWLVDENAMVCIFSEDDEECLACYDGRNSIDLKYVTCEVVRIAPAHTIDNEDVLDVFIRNK